MRMQNTVVIRLGEHRIPLKVEDGSVVLEDVVCCPSNLREYVDKLAYGIKVDYDGRNVYFTPLEKSGLTPYGKTVVKKAAPSLTDAELSMNQLPLYIVLMVVAIIATCSVFPESEVCKRLFQGASDVWWKVAAPLAALTFGLVVGYMAVNTMYSEGREEVAYV